MTDTRTKRMISALPAELEPGDEIRDRGILRTVSKVDTDERLRSVVEVWFEPVEDKPNSLGIDAGVTVTAWRAGGRDV